MKYYYFNKILSILALLANISLFIYLNNLLINTGGYIGATLTDDEVFSPKGYSIFISLFLVILLTVKVLRNLKRDEVLIKVSNLFIILSGIVLFSYPYIGLSIFQGPIQLTTICLILSTVLYIISYFNSYCISTEAIIVNEKIGQNANTKKRFLLGFVCILAIITVALFILDYCFECSGIPTDQILDYLPIVQTLWLLLVLALPNKNN